MEKGGMDKEQYIKQLFSQFCLSEKEFELAIYYKSLSQILNGIVNVDIELMNLKDEVDGLLKNKSDCELIKWKKFSFCLRKVAQKLYIKHSGIIEDKRFLKIISEEF